MIYNSDPAERLNKNQIAKYATKFIKSNSIINLGIGIPSLCAQYINDPTILLHAENGVYGLINLQMTKRLILIIWMQVVIF